MVNAVGKALVRDNMMKDKKFYTLTADYIFGHDLARAAKSVFDANGGKLIATSCRDRRDRLQPLSVETSARASRTWCARTSPANQVTNLVKQYAEFGLPYPIVGFNLNTRRCLGRRRRQSQAAPGRRSGTHTSDVPASKTFVDNFIKKNGKPPENHAWIEYVSLKIMAQAMNETKSTDTNKMIRLSRDRSQVRHPERPPVATFRSGIIN